MYYFDFDYESEERYDPAKYMEFTEGAFDILTSYFINELQKLPVNGIFQVTSEFNRPDLASTKIYGLTKYWWLILLYNNLSSPWELVIGLELSYPSINDIENLYFSLKAKGLREE